MHTSLSSSTPVLISSKEVLEKGINFMQRSSSFHRNTTVLLNEAGKTLTVQSIVNLWNTMTELSPRSPRSKLSPRSPRSPRSLRSKLSPLSPRSPRSPRDPRSKRCLIQPNICRFVVLITADKQKNIDLIRLYIHRQIAPQTTVTRTQQSTRGRLRTQSSSHDQQMSREVTLKKYSYSRLSMRKKFKN